MPDHVIQRTLGGVRLVDHLTGETVSTGVRITSAQLTFRPTRSGAFQISMAPGFAVYSKSFDPVPAVAPANFDLQVEDASRRFLPVLSRITLPRDARPEAQVNRVDQPIEVVLPSARSRAQGLGWSSLTVTLVTAQGRPIRGALVQVMRAAADEELGWGLSDAAGGALIPLLDIPTLQEATPGGPDDDGSLITAVTRLKLIVTADPGDPWPVDLAKLRLGLAPLRRFTPATLIELTAGGRVHQRLSLALN